MCGSGTVPKMCIENGRDFIGIDTSEKYCDPAQQRVAGAQPPVFHAECADLALVRAERKETAASLGTLPMFGAAELPAPAAVR